MPDFSPYPSLLCFEPRIKAALLERYGDEAADVEAGLRMDGAEKNEEALELMGELIFDEAQTVEEYTGDGGAGAFPICILNFGPLYWVDAQEFDQSGFFLTLKEARVYAHVEYGEYFVEDEESADPSSETGSALEDDGVSNILEAEADRLLSTILSFDWTLPDPALAWPKRDFERSHHNTLTRLLDALASLANAKLYAHDQAPNEFRYGVEYSRKSTEFRVGAVSYQGGTFGIWVRPSGQGSATGAVWVDAERGHGFIEVPFEVWEFKLHGERHLEAWLTRRQGQILKQDERFYVKTMIKAIAAWNEFDRTIAANA